MPPDDVQLDEGKRLMALYLQLDVNWPDDDPIIEVGLEAAVRAAVQAVHR